ncbi:SNF2 family N-terminal domain-containing protein [Xylariaceae sp. FL0662B]|nr:SNF2 family N-terminal domain-containing protein [Xylariaceae sp. FL0662B]
MPNCTTTTMGRSSQSGAVKAQAYRQKASVRVERSRTVDPFPMGFLDFLQAFQKPQSDDATERIEPPKKRARIEPVEPVAIARESFTLSRPVQSKFPNAGPMSCADVGRDTKIHYNEDSRILTVSSIGQSPYGTFKSELDLGRPKFTNRVLTILNVITRSRDDQSEEGALWVAVTISFERNSSRDYMHFSLGLSWNSSVNTLRNGPRRALSQQVLDTFFESSQDQEQGETNKLLPQAFHDAAFTPNRDQSDFSSLSVPRLASKLFPFQCRALQWLLNREGVRWNDKCSDGSSGLEPLPPPSSLDPPLSFSVVKDADGRSVYISDLYHIVTRDLTAFRGSEAAVKGGILAEEMGLGKTVETISLILTHLRPPEPPIVFDKVTAQNTRSTGATLIVTPATLKNQWLSEFSKHAPHLHVMMYEGLKGLKGGEGEVVTELVEHDVVITTYNVLQAEIHYAEAPPSRSMRYERRYQRPMSPLVQISWWRVCLDEAQQIESGVSSAAKVARLIPRVNAWGITGTPVKNDIKDLWGLLLFLRYEPFASSTAIWERLTTSHKHKSLFISLFNRISLRHTKRAVRDELALPSQKRYVITMPFTAIEEQHYQAQFKALARDFGLNEHGAPLKEDWDPEDPYIVDLMKRALAQLRQTVLHPELGPGRLRAMGQKSKPLRTIDEVLDAMIEQSESAIRADQRTYLLNKLTRGQILENTSRMKDAIKLWQEVVDEVKPLEEECREQLEIELEKARQAGIDEEREETSSSDSQGSKDPNEEVLRARISECRRKLRSMLDIHHRAIFFIASGFYQIKENRDMTDPDSEEHQKLEENEARGYETAKHIRKEILRESLSKALSHMASIKSDATSQSFVEIPEIQFSSLQGLESRRVVENLHALGNALDEQANLIDEWREHVIRILLQPLVDAEGENEITGDEYEDSTKIQDELMVYTLALRAAVADRQDALSGLENERIKYEVNYAKRRALQGEGHCPEKLLDLLEQRQKSMLSSQGTSFRGIITDLRELATNFRHEASSGSSRANVELDIVQRQLQLAQRQMVIQNKAATALERELDRFTTAMNARVAYYRQLQGVSDTVAPLNRELHEDLEIWAIGLLRNEQTMLRRFTAAQSKHRYLLHLKDAGHNSDGLCIICQNSFTLGVLTVCGHQFCKECLMTWLGVNRNCPVCKKQLTAAMLHDITLKKQELKLHQEQSHVSADGESPHKSKELGIYSQFSNEKLDAIRNIDLNGPSYATKIDTLIKHLLWLREEDPGAKSIIFSQFREFLQVLSQAFTQHRIGHTSFDTGKGITKFKEDPGIECFLMDARAHASGLNLVNASHVFLCEPLLNTALELQAIARVDRIGQEHETTVWLYLIDGTVEESIYNLSIQRRMEHMGENDKGKSKEPTLEVLDLNLEVANSMELQQAALTELMSKDKELGEVIDKNDLWTCLFGHLANNKASPGVTDDRYNNPAVMGFLAAEAAEERMQGQSEAGPSA